MSATLIVGSRELDQELVVLSGDSHHHLVRVRRAQVGERVRLVDGLGRARWAEVSEIGGKAVRLAVVGPAPEGEAARRIALLVAMPKRERASWLVEKVTELGVAQIDLVSCERGPREVGGGVLERLRRVARSAVEQSGRSCVPTIGTVGFEGAVARVSESPSAWLMDPRGESPATVAGGGSILLVVGPEGGFSVAENSALTAAGAAAVRFGTTILRVETAAVVACGWAAALPDSTV